MFASHAQKSHRCPRPGPPLALGPAVAPASAAGPSPAPLVKVADAPAAQEIEGRYIVTLKGGVDPAALVKDKSVKARHLYRKVLNGFAAELSAERLEELRRDSRVLAIEEDQRAGGTATQTNPPWGLDRIDQRSGLSGTYSYGRNGYGVTAYIIDSGIDTAHPDFGGRARNVFDAYGGSGQDCNGHGTHVAGTVGGSTFGVAKGVQLRGVRVLGCDNRGSYSAIIAGFDWVRLNAVKPAVANASWAAATPRR